MVALQRLAVFCCNVWPCFVTAFGCISLQRLAAFRCNVWLCFVERIAAVKRICYLCGKVIAPDVTDVGVLAFMNGSSSSIGRGRGK